MKATLDRIVDNIENRRIDGGVFVMTGPDTLNAAIGNQIVNTRRDKITCTQGTFTNEHFNISTSRVVSGITKRMRNY